MDQVVELVEQDLQTVFQVVQLHILVVEVEEQEHRVVQEQEEQVVVEQEELKQEV